jgi:quinoprotein glucose dehydrogenase
METKQHNLKNFFLRPVCDILHPVVRAGVPVVCLFAGAMLGAGGVWLIVLGGSGFYALTGLLLILIAVLLYRRSAWSYWAYATLNLVTLAWAIFEVGLDWWQLMPRGDFIVLFGFFFIAVPGFAISADGALFKSGRIALVGSVLVCGAVALFAVLNPTHDLAGALPSSGVRDIASAFAADKNWTAYGGTYAGDRYSTLDQITPTNVGRLRVEWTFHTGDVRGKDDPVETTYEVTPLKVGETLYLCTPHDLVFALDAETGQEKWRFDPTIRQPSFQTTQHLTCRGVSYFDATKEGAASTTEAIPPDCVKRIFLPTVDGRLIALSADNGRVCPGFGGPGGAVNLWQNMPNVTPGSYYSTSPPLVAKDLIIVGGAVNDNVSLHEPSGVIRAFNIYTGALVWNWDSRRPNETAPLKPRETYSENSPNSWSISSYDAETGLIYVPMGNRSPDQFGAGRDQNVEKFSSSIVALNAETGAVAWVFQSTHHDLWDMDVPAQPSLLDLAIGRETVPALVETTKQGELFVLDRRTGKPVFPVKELPAPQGAVEGDFSSPTQPVSAISFDPLPLKESSMWGLSPFDQLACRIKFRLMRYEGRYTAPSTQGSLIYPGNFGVFNWGGVAVDPERRVIFAMPVYLAFTSTLIPRRNAQERFVTSGRDAPFNENFGAPYAVKMAPFLSPIGKPCQAPPWGYVAGVDLTTGEIVYRHVNGTIRDLTRIPFPFKMGVPGIGGPIITRGGVAFLSGTLDYFARAYDVTTGNLLWESRLPAGGQATPMTYWSDRSDRQFVVVVAGGHGSLGTKSGDAIIAYALPKP